MKGKMLGLLACGIFGSWLSQAQVVVSVKETGGLGDGQTLNTAAIQRAIDLVAQKGGGTVVLPSGDWLSGTVELKSRVTLHLEAGARLLGSPRLEDYRKEADLHADRQPYHLLIARHQSQVGLSGTGTIDGQGKNWWEPHDTLPNGQAREPRWIKAKPQKISPLIEFEDCQDVRIADVSIQTGGGWNLHLLDCQRVDVRGLRIVNSLFSPNSDGIDITGGSDIMISHCFIRTCDDGICLKTTQDSGPLMRVTVTNCILETSCVALKLGANESFKDIRDVAFSNCVVERSSRMVGLYSHEGGVFENIVISNITGNTKAPIVLNRPIHIQVEKRTPESKAGAIRNVSISNFTAKTTGRILMTAAPGTRLENITLRDVRLEYPWIEDPVPYAQGVKSSQFPKEPNHPQARVARAAVVAENIQNLVVDNLMLSWPNGPIPADWQIPEAVENGGFRIFTKLHEQAWSGPFAALWAQNIQGGYLYLPLAPARGKSPATVLKNCQLDRR